MTKRAGLLAFALAALVAAGPSPVPAAEQELVEPAPQTGAQAPGEGEAGETAAAPGRDTRRDPFRPFNLDIQPKRHEPPKTPLEQYELGSLTLVAVIWNVSDPKAMVEDDAGLGYTVGVGTPIGRNGGVITKIEPNSITIEEQFVDFYGEKKKKDVVLKLEPEGEKRP